MRNNRAPSLRALQRLFAEAVTLERDVDAMQSLIESKPGGATAAERLAVYSDAWFIRLEESLGDDFSVLRERLGHEVWTETLRGYLRAFPSRSFTLAKAGNHLPGYLKETGFSAWKVELAQLELDLYRSQIATDSIPFAVAELQSISEDDAEDLRLALQPSVFLHEFTYNVLGLLHDAKPMIAPSRVVVYREAWMSHTEEVETEEFEFLAMLASGALLGELADRFSESDWVSWLSKWSQRGAIGPASVAELRGES